MHLLFFDRCHIEKSLFAEVNVEKQRTYFATHLFLFILHSTELFSHFSHFFLKHMIHVFS